MYKKILICALLQASYTLSNNWGFLAEIAGGAGSEAGTSVSLNSDGRIVAFGEPIYSGGFGRVRIFQHSGATEFSKESGFTGENNGDLAGSSVSLSSNGQIVAIGEPGYYSGSESGRVRIFQYTDDSWTSLGGFTGITGENVNDYAGNSVALSLDGQIIAIGEVGYNNFAGRVRIFQYSGAIDSWTSLGGFTGITGGNVYDQAGNSVALSQDGLIVAIGEPGYYSGSESGRVRVFQYSGVIDSWINLGGITGITGENVNDQAGTSVSLSQDGLIVAIGEEGYNDFAGRVRVFQYFKAIDSWIILGGSTDITGAYEGTAGSAVSLSSSGHTVAVGEPGYSFDYNFSSGRVRIFEYNGSAWNSVSTINGESGNRAGTSVSLNSDNSIFAIGEPGYLNGDNRGLVIIIFKQMPLNQLEYLKTKGVNFTHTTFNITKHHKTADYHENRNFSQPTNSN